MLLTTERSLTDRQARFIEEYQIDANATQAAVRAGYKVSAAEDVGRRLLRQPAVAAALAEARAARSLRTQVTADRVLEEYARIAFSDIRRFAAVSDEGGVQVRPSEGWSDDDAAAVAELSETSSDKGGAVRFKLHDKVRALDALAKHLGLWSDGANVNVATQFVITD